MSRPERSKDKRKQARHSHQIAFDRRRMIDRNRCRGDAGMEATSQTMMTICMRATRIWSTRPWLLWKAVIIASHADHPPFRTKGSRPCIRSSSPPKMAPRARWHIEPRGSRNVGRGVQIVRARSIWSAKLDSCVWTKRTNLIPTTCWFNPRLEIRSETSQ